MSKATQPLSIITDENVDKVRDIYMTFSNIYIVGGNYQATYIFE